MEKSNYSAVENHIEFCNTARHVVLSGLSLIPEVGGLVSGLMSFLWPEAKPNVWLEVQDQVEKLLNRKLSAAVTDSVNADLKGLESVLSDYKQALKDSQSRPSFISEKYNVALGQFEHSKPHFQMKGYEGLLLPQLAQVANLHLALLRDGFLFGKDWGWTPQIVNDMGTKLSDEIADYIDWVNKNLPDLSPIKTKNLSAWIHKNKMATHYHFGVTDFAFFWPYFDPRKHKTGKIESRPTRTILYGPLGNQGENFNLFDIEVSTKERLSELRVWGWDRVDALQQAFGTRKNWSGRMGDGGGADVPPHGWNGSISSDNPIVEVSGSQGRSGSFFNVNCEIRFKFKDGTVTNTIGGNYPPVGGSYKISFKEHVLSQVYSTGGGDTTGVGAVNIILGFRYEASYDSDSNDKKKIDKRSKRNRARR